jgi:hypothetical protein
MLPHILPIYNYNLYLESSSTDKSRSNKSPKGGQIAAADARGASWKRWPTSSTTWRPGVGEFGASGR